MKRTEELQDTLLTGKMPLNGDFKPHEPLVLSEFFYSVFRLLTPEF